jgi:hypothetical protein
MRDRGASAASAGTALPDRVNDSACPVKSVSTSTCSARLLPAPSGRVQSRTSRARTWNRRCGRPRGRATACGGRCRGRGAGPRSRSRFPSDRDDEMALSAGSSSRICPAKDRETSSSRSVIFLTSNRQVRNQIRPSPQVARDRPREHSQGGDTDSNHLGTISGTADQEGLRPCRRRATPRRAATVPQRPERERVLGPLVEPSGVVLLEHPGRGVAESGATTTGFAPVSSANVAPVRRN